MHVKPLGYRDLVDIPVRDCQEPLVNLRDVAPQVICAPINADTLPFCPEGILVRKSVGEKLHLASVKLAERNPKARLQIVYGYRHPSIQERYFREISAKIREENPGVAEQELIEKVHALIAVPSVAGHPTGGAIDATVVDDGAPVDMGTPIWDLKSSSPIATFAEGLTKSQHENRLLLREVLMMEGFAPFDGEWWHFSYGDREWAAYYKMPCAVYAPLVLNPVR